MKTILSLIIFVLLFIVSNAQIKTHEINLSNKILLDLENESPLQALPFKIKKISVIDARFDTCGIGYLSSENHVLKTGVRLDTYGAISKKAWPKVYSLTSSVDIAVGNWATNYLQSTKNDSLNKNLLIVIKKLWLSPAAAPALNENEKRGQPNEGWDAGVICKLEFYLEKDSIYYPLYRTDSIYTLKENLSDNTSLFITTALRNSLSKLFTVNMDKVFVSGRRLSITDIYTSIKKNRTMPILNTGSFTKGVYKTFDEFKMNAPSLKDYELRKSELGDLLYVKENNAEYPERNAWGYCDGINIFINSGDKYSTVIKNQDAFYFEGIKGIIRKTKHDVPYTSLFNVVTNTGRKVTKFKGVIKYYQIDMETGEAY
jgi:hypothetical protein